jgi:hypothetical protein
VLVGDLIARFNDEAEAVEALLTLGDLALTTLVSRAAAEQKISIGEFVTESVARFANCASDDAWLMMFGRMAQAEDPGKVFLRHVLSAAVANNSHDHTAMRYAAAAHHSAPLPHD